MKKYSIIVVENDEDERFFMQESFDSVNLFEILAMVKNGNELFEWIAHHENEKPDLILTDLIMPGKNGFDILAEVNNRKDLVRIPIFITSTSSIPAIADKCIESGAADYLKKPDSLLEYSEFFTKLYQSAAEKINR